METETRLKALEVEINYIEKLQTNEQIDRESLYLLEEHIHRMRVAVTNRLQYRGLFIWTIVKRGILNIASLFKSTKHNSFKARLEKNKKVARLKMEMAQAAIAYLRETYDS